MVESMSTLVTILKLAKQHTEDEINIILFVNALAANSISGLAAVDSLLSAYVQNNFLGPALELEVDLSNLDKIGLTKLSLNSETPFALVRTPCLLWIARCLSAYFSSESTTFKFQYAICRLKVLYLHQHLFNETRSASLKDEFDNLVLLIETDSFEPTFDTDSFTFLQISCYLAAYYYDFKLCNKLKEYISNMLGFSGSLSSALGTKTKAQLESVAQLFVQVTRPSPLDSDNNEKETALPKAIMLQDDNLLDFINFTDGVQISYKLSVPEQAYLLNIGEIHRRSHPHDELVNEQCLAFITAVIRSVYNDALDAKEKSPISWPILTEALFKRGSLEQRSYSRLERTLNQLEELIKQYSGIKPLPTARGYTQFFWSRMPSLWELEFSNADILTKLGSVRSALDIHMRWQQWDQVIQCYTFLEQRDLAEKIIRERIASGYETPELYCCLGDVTAESKHYEVAWELSQYKSARAMRSLGLRAFYVDKDLERATECMEKSLFLNRFQVSLWFTLGCCYMQKRDFKNSERAFRFCVGFDPDNFQAWNNLASSVTFTGRRGDAFKLLKEATKWNFESWMIWDNLLLMGLDVGAFGESIRAYHRLIDLREKHVDAQALGILVEAISKDLPDDQNLGAGRHRAKLLELFGRVTATSPSDAQTWKHYATLLLNEGAQLSTTTFERAVQCLQKCYQCRLRSATTGWELVKETRSALVEDLQTLGRTLLENSSFSVNSTLDEEISVDGKSKAHVDLVSPVFIASSLSSLRLNINSILTRLKAARDKCFDTSVLAQLAEDIDSISNLKTRIDAAR